MSNVNKKFSKRLNVEMGNERVCTEVMTTDPLGPCLFFLVSFLSEGERVCYLKHHDFADYNDYNKPQLQVLNDFLHMISTGLKSELGTVSLRPDNPPGNAGIKPCCLAIGGGDIHESSLIKRSFSVLFNSNKSIKIEFKDHDVAYLYQELINNIIIFASIHKNLSDDEDEKGLFLINIFLK